MSPQTFIKHRLANERQRMKALHAECRDELAIRDFNSSMVGERMTSECLEPRSFFPQARRRTALSTSPLISVCYQTIIRVATRGGAAWPAPKGNGSPKEPWLDLRGKPGTANQFQRRELVAVPVLRRTHESGIFEPGDNLP